MIYLATPYSHPDENVRRQRFEVANAAAAWLMQSGNFVLSPISHSHPIALAGELPLSWDFWSDFNETLMTACDRLIVIKQEGWKESVGVAAEIAIAQRLDIAIAKATWDGTQLIDIED